MRSQNWTQATPVTVYLQEMKVCGLLVLLNLVTCKQSFKNFMLKPSITN